MTLTQASEALYQHHLGMAPIRIELELTEACNLGCLFCYNSRNPAFVAPDDALRILQSLAAQGVLEIVLTGGEPLLHPDFPAIAHAAGKLFPHALLQTNGMLLDDRLMAVLVDAGFVGLNVSIHGDQEVHDFLTGHPGSHGVAVNAVVRALASTAAVWVNTVLTNRNWRHLESHLLSLLGHGVRNFTFTRFTPTGRGRSASLALTATELAEVARCLERFKQAHRDCTLLLANAVPRCAFPDELAHFSEPCSYGVDRFYVNVHGDLMVCGMSRVVLGNVLREAIRGIKAGSHVYRAICGYEALPSPCKGCKDIRLCRGGCRAAALAATGDLGGMDPLARAE